DVVQAGLGPLLTVPGDDERQAYDVAVRSAVDHEAIDGEQRVEPAPRLIDRLGDEVGGEATLEELLVLERVVELGRRHAARVEPRVQYGVDTLRTSRALGTGDRDVVDVRTVQVETGEVAACQLAQLAAPAHTPVV